jgi:hypothetical protein
MVGAFLPSKGMQLMGAMLNPTPQNASFPPALLDWGAVIPGRCAAAWQRDKLEFQERLFDEMAVSVFWLWGAGWMDAMLTRLQKNVPALNAIRSDVAGSVHNGDSLIKNGLTPLERFSTSHAQAVSMQKLRGSKTALSVISNFLIIALLIPRLNQMKTDWLVKRVYGKHPNGNQSGHAPATAPDKATDKTTVKPFLSGGNASKSVWGQPAEPVLTPPVLTPDRFAAQSPLSYRATRANQAFGGLQTNSAAPIGAGNKAKALSNNTLPNTMSNTTRFGQMLSNPLADTVLKAAEVVKSTDYGYILTGDGAMLAGRSYSAFTRPNVSKKDTVGEVREILWRDAVSSYLYLWGIPHLTRLAGQLIKPFGHSETTLEPMVAQLMLHHAGNTLKQHHQTTASASDLRRWWTGHADSAADVTAEKATAKTAATALNPAKQWLNNAMGEVHNPADFWQTLTHTLSLNLNLTPDKPIHPLLLDQLKSQAPQTLNATSFGQWLDTLSKTRLAGISFDEQHNIVRSLKQAFGQTVGLHLAVAKQQLPQQLANAPKTLTTATQQRLTRHAVAHTQQQLAWRFRQLVNHLPVDVATQAISVNVGKNWLAFADALDAASLQPVLTDAFSEPFTHLPQVLMDLPDANLSATARGLQHASKTNMLHLLKNPVLQQIEAPSLAPWRPQVAEHILTGAARHDPALMHEAMALVGLAPKDFTTEIHPQKWARLCTAMDKFWDHLCKQLPVAEAKGAEVSAALPAEQLMAQARHIARWQNMVPRYATLVFGVVASMVSLGLVVPWVQYWMTRKLTGRDEQPALAALKERYGMAK